MIFLEQNNNLGLFSLNVELHLMPELLLFTKQKHNKHSFRWKALWNQYRTITESFGLCA